MHRLFIAIDFPPLVRAQLKLMCHGLPGARWMPEEQLHLTLRFIGEVEGAGMLDIQEALGRVSAPGFDLALSGVGFFPPRGTPRVVWAGIQDPAPLVTLRHRVDAALTDAGIPPEGRKYAPHVTLARLRDTPPRRVAEFLAHHNGFWTDPFPVMGFHLYESTLTPKGAIHNIIGSVPLGPREEYS